METGKCTLGIYLHDADELELPKSMPNFDNDDDDDDDWDDDDDDD